MDLRVGVEIEPAVFREEDLAQAGAEIMAHVQMGYVRVRADAARLPDLLGLRGVVSLVPVVACEDRLEHLPRDAVWTPLLSGGCQDMLSLDVDAARFAGGTAILRLTARVQALTFVRSHRTAALDLELWAPEAPGRWRRVLAHSDGLRDQSLAGQHEWKPGEEHVVAMWVGHLERGAYRLRAGVLSGGWIRVKGRPQPCLLEGEVRLEGATLPRGA